MALKVQQDGETYFVQPEGSEDRLPLDLSGYLPEATVRGAYVPKDHFESEIGRRVAAAKKGLTSRDEILGDESILDDVIERYREPLSERLGVKATSEAEIERLRAQIAKREVEPLRAELTARDEAIGRLREKSFLADYRRAAQSVGVSEDMVDLVERWARDRVQYNDELDDFVVVNSEGKPELAGGDIKGRRHPYQTVADLLSEIERGGDRKSWFSARSRPGADIRPGGSGGAVSYADFEKMSGADREKLYRENRDTWQIYMDRHREAGMKALGLG